MSQTLQEKNKALLLEAAGRSSPRTRFCFEGARLPAGPQRSQIKSAVAAEVGCMHQSFPRRFPWIDAQRPRSNRITIDILID